MKITRDNITNGIELIKKKYSDIDDFRLYLYANYDKAVNDRYANTDYYLCCEKGFNQIAEDYNRSCIDSNVMFIAIGIEYKHTEGNKLPGGEDIIQRKIA